MDVHPPRAPLFPYTTLSQSAGRRSPRGGRRAGTRRRSQPTRAGIDRNSSLVQSTSVRSIHPPVSASTAAPTAPTARSEEHTSELQSRQYIVCRLLLETKQNK